MGGSGTRRTGRPWGDLKGDDLKLHEFARHLRELVDRSGRSLRAVGECCACSSTTVSKRLSGAELPTWEFVASLVEACVADPAVLEKRKGQSRALWQRATELPSRPREQRAATDVATDPRAMVIAAQTAAIDAQRQLLDLHDRLHDAHQQLFDSQRAERSAAQMVWVLYWALGRAFQLVGELTRNRDIAARLASQSGLEPAQHQLNAAQGTRARTERQLERAQSEHERAVTLADAAAQKVAALQAMLMPIDSAGSPDIQSAEVVGADQMGIDDLIDLNGGLDRIERLLDAQDGELARLDHEINGPVALNKDVARLREIGKNSDISLAHRLKACDSLTDLGSNHHGDAAAAFRSMILDKSLGIADRASVARKLARLGGPYRQEALAIFQNLLNEESQDSRNRIAVLRWYRLVGDHEQSEASEQLRRIALDDSDETLDRVQAASVWWQCVPAAGTQIVTLLKEIRDREDRSVVVKEEAERIIREISTNPW